MNQDITRKFKLVDELVRDLVQSGVYRPDDAERIRYDVKQVLQNLAWINPGKGIFTANDGNDHTLFKLEGLITTEFRNRQYHTPVRVWLSRGYPRTPPICFLAPTQQMMVESSHPHVSTDGLVHIPYLQEWDSESSYLIVLFTQMVEEFNMRPPLRARPRVPARVESREVSRSTGSSWHSYDDLPSRESTPQAFGDRNVGNHVPPSRHGSPHTSSFSPVDQAAANRAVSIPTTIQRQPSVDPEETRHARERVNDKLKNEMQQLLIDARDQFDIENQRTNNLQEAQQRLTQFIEDKEKEINELHQYQEQLNETKQNLETFIRERQQHDINTIPAADLIRPADAWSKQLITAVSKASAIEDAYWLVETALENGTIDTTAYAHKIRELARKQFEHIHMARQIQAASQSV